LSHINTNFPPEEADGEWCPRPRLKGGAPPDNDKGGARPSHEPEWEGEVIALPAAGVRSDSSAAALDPDLTPVTPAPDTPRGFSG